MSTEDFIHEWRESTPNEISYRIRANEESQKKAAWIIFEAFKNDPEGLKKYRERPWKNYGENLEDMLYQEILRRIKEKNGILISGKPMDSKKDTTSTEMKVNVLLTGEFCWSSTKVWLPKEFLIQGSDPRNNSKTITGTVMTKLRELLEKAGIRW